MLRAALRATPAVAGVAGVSAAWWFEHNYEEVSAGPAPKLLVDDATKPDVLVVGSGVVGVSTAYMIARQVL